MQREIPTHELCGRCLVHRRWVADGHQAVFLSQVFERSCGQLLEDLLFFVGKNFRDSEQPFADGNGIGGVFQNRVIFRSDA